MSSANITAQPTPPEGHVHLVLFEQQPDPFYLEIPLRVIRDVCRYPPKYLRYLGWCVLGVEGSLQDRLGAQVDLNGDLVDRNVYYYRLPGAQQDVLSRAVDLEVIKLRTQAPSQTTETRNCFRQELATRDGEQCVWTGMPPGVGMHIIPWSKGDEWLQFIVANRPGGGEPRLDTLKSINDIRNGITGSLNLHTPYFDPRAVVILKTPNCILQTDDVPRRHNRRLPAGTTYPRQSRYTLQWLAADLDNEFLRTGIPNNSDAAFVSPQKKPKPSDLLLHYNYGAAAVKNWGRNCAVLANRPGLSRPQAPATVVMGPTTTVGDRTIMLTELEAAWAKGTQQQPTGSGGGTSSAAATDSVQPVWDEDDVMLFFWGNSKPSKERHAKEERERKENIDKWRAETVVSAQEGHKVDLES